MDREIALYLNAYESRQGRGARPTGLHVHVHRTDVNQHNVLDTDDIDDVDHGKVPYQDHAHHKCDRDLESQL